MQQTGGALNIYAGSERCERLPPEKKCLNSQCRNHWNQMTNPAAKPLWERRGGNEVSLAFLLNSSQRKITAGVCRFRTNSGGSGIMGKKPSKLLMSLSISLTQRKKSQASAEGDKWKRCSFGRVRQFDYQLQSINQATELQRRKLTTEKTAIP